MALHLCGGSAIVIIVINLVIYSECQHKIFPNHRYDQIPRNNEIKLNDNNRSNERLIIHLNIELKKHQTKILSKFHEKLIKNKTDTQTTNYVIGVSDKKQKINTQSISDKSFISFVTPKREASLTKRYEVTTEKFEDNPYAFGVDNDETIDIDDGDLEDIEEEKELENERQNEELKSQVFGYSYNKKPHDYRRLHYNHGSYGYGITHLQSNYNPYYTYNREVPTNRVKMQVFRGPTRSIGQRQYTQWGYYIIQPSDHQLHHNPHNYN